MFEAKVYGYNINVDIVAVFCDLYKKIIWKRNLYVCCVACILQKWRKILKAEGLLQWPNCNFTK